jgi:hypothetical protein
VITPARDCVATVTTDVPSMVTAAAAPYYTLFVSASRRSFWALESHRTTRSRNAAKHWLRCLPPQMRTDRTVFSHSNPTASSLHQRAGPPASRLQPHLRTATAWSGDREPDEPCGREQERAPGAASSNYRVGGSRSRSRRQEQDELLLHLSARAGA